MTTAARRTMSAQGPARKGWVIATTGTPARRRQASWRVTTRARRGAGPTSAQSARTTPRLRDRRTTPKANGKAKSGARKRTPKWAAPITMVARRAVSTARRVASLTTRRPGQLAIDEARHRSGRADEPGRRQGRQGRDGHRDRVEEVAGGVEGRAEPGDDEGELADLRLAHGRCHRGARPLPGEEGAQGDPED